MIESLGRVGRPSQLLSVGLLLALCAGLAEAQDRVPYHCLTVLPAVNATTEKRLIVFGLSWQLLLQERLRELPGIQVVQLQDYPDLIEGFAGHKFDVTKLETRNQIAEQTGADTLLAVTITAGPPQWGLKAELIQPAVGPKPMAELPPVSGELPTVLGDAIVTNALKALLNVPEVTLEPYVPEVTGDMFQKFSYALWLWPYASPDDATKGQLAKSSPSLQRLVAGDQLQLAYRQFMLAKLAEGKGAEASSVLTKYCQKHKREARAQFLLGEYLARQHQDLDALKPLTDAANKSKGSYATVTALADCYRRMGKLDEALGQYAAALRAWPNVWPFAQLQADMAFEAHRFEVAAKAYRQVAQLQPTMPEAYAGLTKSLLAQPNARNNEEAYQTARQLAALQPDNLDALALLARAGLAAGHATDIRNAAQKVAEGRQKDAEAQQMLGTIALQCEDYAAAETALAAAVKLAPKEAEAWRLLAQARLYGDKLDGAAQALAAALKVAPDVERPELLLELAEIDFYRGKYEEGVQSALAAAKLLPKDPSPLYAAARLEMWQGDAAKMVEHYLAALVLDPGAAGQGQQVIAELARITDENKGFHLAKLALAVLTEAAGRLRDARRLYKAYLAAPGTEAMADYARERVDAIDAAGAG